MASVLMDPVQKRDSMASGNNRGQKEILLASPQYASVPDPRQNEKNNRGKKPLLHWCQWLKNNENYFNETKKFFKLNENQ